MGAVIVLENVVSTARICCYRCYFLLYNLDVRARRGIKTKSCQFTVERVLIPISPNSIQSSAQNLTHFDISSLTRKQVHSPLSQNIYYFITLYISYMVQRNIWHKCLFQFYSEINMLFLSYYLIKQLQLEFCSL